MEIISYVLINVAVILFCLLSIYFLKYQSKYIKQADEKKDKSTDSNNTKSEDADVKEIKKDLEKETEGTDTGKTDEDVESVDSLFAEEGKQRDFCVSYKKLFSDNFSFVVSMIMLNLALGNALVAIYSNHIVTDIKSMLIVTALWPIALIDFREKKIPNAILKMLVYFRVLILIPELILVDNSVQIVISGAVAAFAIFLAAVAVGLLMKGSIGMGDVKLFIVLGLYLGLEGIWSAVFCSLIVSFFISVYLLATKKVGRKDSIPFAPAIMLGTFLSVFLTGI